jgi:amidase
VRIDRVSTFITRLDHPGSGPRLAVKDLIDVRGVPTTAGCKAVADAALPAAADAVCMAGARAADAAIVGKANLFELAFGASGTNPWYGTPVNPLDPGLVPGGSSSGSAVAVADGEADYGYGTDTGGSVRIPAAFCGLAGLKTTHGRISLDGVYPLAPEPGHGRADRA